MIFFQCGWEPFVILQIFIGCEVILENQIIRECDLHKVNVFGETIKLTEYLSVAFDLGNYWTDIVPFTEKLFIGPEKKYFEERYLNSSKRYRFWKWEIDSPPSSLSGPRFLEALLLLITKNDIHCVGNITQNLLVV